MNEKIEPLRHKVGFLLDWIQNKETESPKLKQNEINLRFLFIWKIIKIIHKWSGSFSIFSSMSAFQPNEISVPSTEKMSFRAKLLDRKLLYFVDVLARNRIFDESELYRGSHIRLYHLVIVWDTVCKIWFLNGPHWTVTFYMI